MSSEGLPVDGVVGTDIVLNARSTQQATDEAKSSLSADSAAQSADAAFKFSREAKTVTVVASDAADRAEAAAAADAVSLQPLMVSAVPSTAVIRIIGLTFIIVPFATGVDMVLLS